MVNEHLYFMNGVKENTTVRIYPAPLSAVIYLLKKWIARTYQKTAMVNELQPKVELGLRFVKLTPFANEI